MKFTNKLFDKDKNQIMLHQEFKQESKDLCAAP